MTKQVFLIFLWIIFPIGLLAQDEETVIIADQITIDNNNNLHATGNLEVRRGEVVVKAHSMKIDNSKKIVELGNIREFSDGNSLQLAGENAILSDNLSSGIISAAQVLIDDTIRLRAEKITLKNSKLDRAENVNRITSCEECESGFPLWHFTANSATNDPENQNIVYRNVTLKVRGVPVGYIPYLRLPNSNVVRARGFLIPGLKITSNLGVGATLPYFIPIGESRDLLLTPYVSSKTKTIQYRYRQKFTDGDIVINGALSQDDISNKDIRSYYKASGNFKLAYGINLKIEGGQTNDEVYLGDHSYGSIEDLDTKITLGKTTVNKDSLFGGSINYVRDNRDDKSLEEFYSLSGQYKKRIKQTLLPGNLFFESEANSSLNVAQGGQVSRPPSSISSEIRYSNARYAGPVKIFDNASVRLTSFVNSENIETWQEEFMFHYGLSTTLALPLYQKRDTLTRQFVPKIMLSFNGQEGKINGDYFVGDNQLSIGNLYAGKKFMSSAESEQGFSFSGGANYRLDWNDGSELGFWLGGVWFQDAKTVQNEKVSLQPKKFHYVGGFEYKANNIFSINGNTVIGDEGKVLETDLTNKIQLKELNFNSRYEFIDAKADSRITKDLENVSFSGSYTGFENFRLSASRRYDISENAIASSLSSLNVSFSNGFWNYQLSQTFDANEPEGTTISAIYDDDCTRVTLSLESASQTTASSDSIQSLSILIQLKPFASFTVTGL